jgi:signal transduction histidine kinase
MIATGESRYGADDLLSVPALTSDGRRISVEFSIAPIRGETGAVAGTVAILRDKTKAFEDLRRLRAAAAENRSPPQ